MRATSIMRSAWWPARRAAWAWKWKGKGLSAIGCQLSAKTFDALADGRKPTAEGKTNMAKQSKRYRALAEKRKTQDPLPVPEAVKVLKNFEGTKFDQSVEIAIRLGID